MIEAAQTGVTEGKAAAHSLMYVPRSISRARVGVEPSSTARLRADGAIASMTHRINFGRAVAGGPEAGTLTAHRTGANAALHGGRRRSVHGFLRYRGKAMTIEDRGSEGASKEVGRTRHTARELRRYEALFATRTRRMRSSAMRDMFALTERPDVISLAGGLPDTTTFAPELFAKLMSQVAATDTARALQYGPTDGMAAARDCVVEVMAAEHTLVAAEDVIVTTGGQQVIDLVCKALIDPGDVIVAEAPTYPGAVPAFSAYEANVVQIPMDDDGMPIDELERVLDGLESEGRRPKLIYTIPNFQNPGGVTMSLQRRKQLVALARSRQLLVLEDNPYGLLRYEGQPLPTLYSLDASTTGHGGASDFVIYLGTFSKILSPGLRLGWAVAPRPVLEKLNLGKQGADLCSSSVTQLFVAAYFAERGADGRPAWLSYLDQLRKLYRSRRDVMLEALETHFVAGATWTQPQGGLFIWATLPTFIDTTDLLARSRETVAFVPGRAAYMNEAGGSSSMRLNFAGSSEADIREGIRRIGENMGGGAGLFGALTRSRGASASTGARAAGSPAQKPGQAKAPGAAPVVSKAANGGLDEAELADVVELPTDRKAATRRRSSR
jgi:2-aminoadipate transaminase